MQSTMPSNDLMSDKSSSNELLPFYCSSCKTKKRFRSLIALRLHMSIVHETPNLYSTPPNDELHEEDNLLKDDITTSRNVQLENSSNLSSRNMRQPTATSSPNTSTSIDEVFIKYDAKIDEVMAKYDKQSRKLENKLKLTKQMEEIQRQKKELYRLSRSWRKTQGVSHLLVDSKFSDQGSLKQSERLEIKALKPSTKHEAALHHNFSGNSNEPNVARQLDLCLELAAQFKSMALHAEEKLKEKIQEEKNMKQYLEVTAVKEQKAKKKLADLMEELLQRAEYAETQLQAYQGLSVEPNQVSRRAASMHNRNHLTKKKDQPSQMHTSTSTNQKKYREKRITRKSAVTKTVQVLGHNHTQNAGQLQFPFSNHDSRKASNRRVALFCIFTQLCSILRCSVVCREWRDLAHHEQLWSRISLHHVNIDRRLFKLMSQWSKETCFLSLKNIGLLNHDSSMPAAGLLEESVEMVLQSCAENLLVLSIDRCDPFLTSRVLWMVSCYNKNICSISYRSSLDPISQQVAWALGSSCRNIVSLELAPLQPCSVRGLFTNNVARLLSWCWPNLQALSFGGYDVDGAGLLAVALNCHHLKVLELDHARGITEEQALTVCKHGLKELHTLLFTHTPVLPSTLLYFLKSLDLKSVFVIVAEKDYFPRSKHRKIAGEYSKISRAFSKIQQNTSFCHIVSIDCN